MVYAALAKLKKNAVKTTISAPGITDSDTTIPVDELSRFRDEDGALILKGIVIGFLNSDDTLPEEITITGASGSSGAGNLTGATRGVNADGSIGAAKAWDSGTEIAVMYSTGVHKQVCDNLAAHESGKSPITAYEYRYLPAGSMSLPDTNPANYQTQILSNGFAEISVGYSNDDEEAFGVVDLPEDWTGGTGSGAVKAKIRWSTSSSATDKKAMFEIWGKRTAPGDPKTAALTLLATTVACLNTGAEYENETAEVDLAAMAGTGKRILFKIKRDKTGESTDTIDAEVKYSTMVLKLITTKASAA